eukprot:756203-Hanusia_phi.AAC.1
MWSSPGDAVEGKWNTCTPTPYFHHLDTPVLGTTPTLNHHPLGVVPRATMQCEEGNGRGRRGGKEERGGVEERGGEEERRRGGEEGR